MTRFGLLLGLILLMISCEKEESTKIENDNLPKPYIKVLGTAQDGSYPQISCEKKCCEASKVKRIGNQYVSSLALIDPNTNNYWLFDCTPDIKEQLSHLNKNLSDEYKSVPGGIFLTHAHVGHYTGLINFGREIMNTDNLPVFAMPRMANFLYAYGPWSLLVDLENINVRSMSPHFPISLNKRIKVIPIPAPHRDEFSETVGFLIETPNKTTFYLPDIDSWTNWKQDIVEIIKASDMVFIDGTFYSGEELPGRNLSEIPHPTILQSMELLKGLENEQKQKVHFIHLNHTNPALDSRSDEYKNIINNGFRVAQQFSVY